MVDKYNKDEFIMEYGIEYVCKKCKNEKYMLYEFM